ncbi:MAG: hypothetical protein ACK4PR_04640 [Gammaproteobacteria bacterium]
MPFGDAITEQPFYNSIVSKAIDIKNQVNDNKLRDALISCFSLEAVIDAFHSQNTNYFPNLADLIDKVEMKKLVEILKNDIYILMQEKPAVEEVPAVEQVEKIKEFIPSLTKLCEKYGHLLNFLYITYKPILEKKLETVINIINHTDPSLIPNPIYTNQDCQGNTTFVQPVPQTPIGNDNYQAAINVLNFLGTTENIMKLCLIVFNSATENQHNKYKSLLTAVAGSDMFKQGFVISTDAVMTFTNLTNFYNNVEQELNSPQVTTLEPLSEQALQFIQTNICSS